MILKSQRVILIAFTSNANQWNHEICLKCNTYRHKLTYYVNLQFVKHSGGFTDLTYLSVTVYPTLVTCSGTEGAAGTPEGGQPADHAAVDGAQNESLADSLAIGDLTIDSKDLTIDSVKVHLR